MALCSVILALTCLSVALETFDPQCTQPEESVHVVKSPKTRGTLDILISTLPTLLACTWTVQHLNVPPKRLPASQSSTKGKLREFLQEGWPKMMWMLITIIAPEMIVALAFQDWMVARRFFNILKSNGDEQNTAWNKTHVFFANMGGFVTTLKVEKDTTVFYDDKRMLETLDKVCKIEKDWRRCDIPGSTFFRERLRKILYMDKDKVPIQASVQNAKSSTQQSLMTDGPSRPIELQSLSKDKKPQSVQPDISIAEDIDESRPIHVRTSTCPPPISITQQGGESDNISRRRRKETTRSKDPDTEDILLYLNAIQLYVAQKLGLIKELPHFKEKDILDKSKSDNFVKLYTLCQVVVFLARITRRFVKKLPITQLEIAVLTFCLCCFLAYCFWWFKPQSVMVSEEKCSKVDYDAKDSPRIALGVDIEVLRYFGSMDFIRTTFVPPFASRIRKPTTPIPNDAMDGIFFTVLGVQTHFAEFAAVLAGVSFGALYFMAWSLPFPSDAEKIIWKVSTGLTAGGPILYDIANIVMTHLDHGRIRHTIVLYGIAVFYLAARLFLIVEMFRTLFFLPPLAFAS